MRLVPYAATPRTALTHGTRRLGAAALLAGSLALVACGGGEGTDGERLRPASPRAAGAGLSDAGEADCLQWRAASPDQRRQVVAALGKVAGRGDYPGERGATLAEDKAVGLLDRACAPDHARRFKLYKLYVRGLAFSTR